jgi:hypothetical protein
VAHADKCNFTDATGDTACNQEIQQLWQKCRVQEQLDPTQATSQPDCVDMRNEEAEEAASNKKIEEKLNPDNGAVTPGCEHGYNPNTCDGGFH